MNPWKTATIVLAILFVAALILWRQSANSAGKNANLTTAQARQLATLNLAIGDTQAYLNWYRLNKADGLTAEEFERNIIILRNNYLNAFPDWANTQFTIRPNDTLTTK
ncbi:MAG: hypothetical protein AAF939_07475 [Planctomycetota bacterium]